jgi:omega-6 fatty acid desaturase / acyl-lipid omega-6 desaturase (Delta-12 desaturase)
MGRHYRSDVKDGPIGFLRSLWTSARWCQWVEPSEGAIGEGKGVLFFRNRNSLGTKPLKLKEVKPVVGNAKGMVVGADDSD